MNKQAYMLHLRQLLESQYNDMKNNPSKSLSKNERIEGYMEAGLIASLVNRNELKQVINNSHKAVFGVTFDERREVNADAENLWDIPTWVRKGVEIDKS
jgi:hypothetical protein